MNFQCQKLLKIQYLWHHRSKHYKITSKKSHSSRGLSKKYQECNQVFLSFDFVKFPLRKLYTIQSLPHCSFKQYIWNHVSGTPLIEDFPTIPNEQLEASWFGTSQCDKQTNQPKKKKQTTSLRCRLSKLRFLLAQEIHCIKILWFSALDKQNVLWVSPISPL